MKRGTKIGVKKAVVKAWSLTFFKPNKLTPPVLRLWKCFTIERFSLPPSHCIRLAHVAWKQFEPICWNYELICCVQFMLLHCDALCFGENARGVLNSARRWGNDTISKLISVLSLYLRRCQHCYSHTVNGNNRDTRHEKSPLRGGGGGGGIIMHTKQFSTTSQLATVAAAADCAVGGRHRSPRF